MKKQVVVTLAVMLGLIAVLAGIKYVQFSRAMAQYANFAMPPEAVTTAPVGRAEWRDLYDTIGTVSAVMGLVLGAEASGVVSKIGFESGAKVNRGDVLIQLDSAVEEANLRAALARAEQAKRNLARAQALKTQSAVSIANLEQAQSELRQVEAEVQSLKAIIERKTITAPFSGRTGIRMVNAGEYVATGAKMVPLYSTNPVFFDFTVPQQAIARVHPKSSVRVTVDAYPDASFEGEVTAVDPQVDPQTRTFRVQATVRNPDDKLRPGMFGRVEVDLGASSSVLFVPQSSVSYAPYGDSVWVVERSTDDKTGAAVTKVRQQIIKLGQKRGDVVAVTDGLKEGEEIVTAGAFKLTPGASIKIDNSVQPPSSDQPTVQDS